MNQRDATSTPPPKDIEVRMMNIDGQRLKVAIRRTGNDKRPLLLFNGISANWQLARPFMEALTETTAIIFDMPGVGGSPTPVLPYRISAMARLASRLVDELGYEDVDVAGVSWGGGVAQQFAHQYPDICRKLVLGATSPGAIMVPGSPSAMLKMVTPRRYLDKAYMRKIAPALYGGAVRKDPSLISAHANAMQGAKGVGYIYQLLAMAGWTSLPWLWALRQPTLIIMGSEDPLVPAINGKLLRMLIPNARLEMIEDGHLFFVTSAAETAARVEQFLRNDAEPDQS